MHNAFFEIPFPSNEPIRSYAPGSSERKSLKKQLDKMAAEQVEIPLVIGGREVTTGKFGDCRMPHDHRHLLGHYHKGSQKEVKMAVQAAKDAFHEWSEMPWEARASVFLKAGDLLAGPYRDILNAATVLSQSKNIFQAEIDSACELIDFYRFNPYYAQVLYRQQPWSSKGCWNYVEHRPLEGFVFAVTPFNFTSIAGNLPTAPALMGCTVVWKPASSAVYPAHYIMRLLEEAGLPPGVINMVPGTGGEIGNPALASPDLAGVHFTGSTATFQTMWQTIGQNIKNYRTYPRIVGETGGKDFIFVHASADIPTLIAATVRGAFEYQGQKCSAASRIFIPESLWSRVKDGLLTEISTIKMGDPRDFSNFMNAVIDQPAFNSIKGYIDYAKNSSDAEFLCGGGCDASKGYFIEPTVIRTTDPKFKLLGEEIFGPVLTVFVYADGELDRALEYCDTGSPYALTGAVFGQDRAAIVKIADRLRYTAGNFYINDKPTGAVVGQQPFGGSRASGTNDKAGSMLNLLRWVSPRTIKESFTPPADYRYPFMQAE